MFEQSSEGHASSKCCLCSIRCAPLCARKDPPLILCKHVFQRPFAKTPQGQGLFHVAGSVPQCSRFNVSPMYIDTFG